MVSVFKLWSSTDASAAKVREAVAYLHKIILTWLLTESSG
jgi:hypothetical protein